MVVCGWKEPVELQLGERRRTACWLHGPTEEIPPGETAPLERMELAVAEEA
jgi:hypothetical protein